MTICEVARSIMQYSYMTQKIFVLPANINTGLDTINGISLTNIVNRSGSRNFVEWFPEQL